MKIKFGEDGGLLRMVTSITKDNVASEVLRCVLIETTGPGQVRVTGATREAWISVQVPAAWDEPGKVLVRAAMLRTLVEARPGDVVCTVGKKGVVLSAGRAKYSLDLLAPDLFPWFEEPKAPAQFTVSAQDFLEASRACSHSAGRIDVRRYMNALCLDVGQAKVALVATDGNRISFAEIEASDITSGGTDLPRALVPEPVLPALASALGQMEGDARVMFDGRCIRIDGGPVSFVSVLVEDNYPQYQRYIGLKNAQTISVECDAAAAALSRMAVLTGNTGVAVKLELSADGMLLSTVNDHAGQAEEVVAGSGWVGDSQSVAVCHRFLRDALSSMRGGNVSMGFPGEGQPITLTHPRFSRSDVIMPLRL